jgi:hypothetical protein
MPHTMALKKFECISQNVTFTQFGIKTTIFPPVYIINRLVCAVQTTSSHQTIALKEKK